MARAWRRRVDPKVVAVTGTNGKTTTKELIAAVASQKLKGMGHTRQPPTTT